MPVQSKLDQPYAQGRDVADRVLEAAGAFAWSISWPKLQVLYVSPSSQALLGTDSLSQPNGARITEALWSSAVELEGGGSTESLVAELWTRGCSQFRFDFTSSSGQLSRFDCRAVLVRDATERPLRIDGIAVLQSRDHMPSGRTTGTAHRLSDVRFLAFRVDRKLRILDWHRTVEAATGISEQEAVGTSIVDLLDADVPGGVAADLAGSLRSGFPVACKLRGQQVILQTVADRSSGLAESERLVIATAFRNPNARVGSLPNAGVPVSPASSAGSRHAFDPLLDCSLEQILIVDVRSLRVVGASRAAQEALGSRLQNVSTPRLDAVSPELHKLVMAQTAYLKEGCLLTAMCSFRGRDGGEFAAEARARYWETPDEGLLIINVRGGGDATPDLPAEGTDGAAVGTLLVDTHGNCQVLSAVDDAWTALLHDAAEGATLAAVARKPADIDGQLAKALSGESIEVELSFDRKSVFCRLEPIRNDGSAVAGLLGIVFEAK